MTETITLPRSVVEEALDALKIGHESAHDCAETFHIEMAGYKQQRHEALDAEVKQISDAIGVLRAALEQPQSVTDCHQSQPQGEQEPVAYYVMNGAALFQLFRSKSQADALAYDLQKRHDLSGSPAHFHVVPLYTHPQPKRQPLTDDAATRLVQSVVAGSDRPIGMVAFGLLVARSTERAHGIGGDA